MLCLAAAHRIYFFELRDPLKFEIEGRRDISGGRKLNDRMTAGNNASSRYFTSICYSADGMFLLAGGNSKFVCIYHVEQQMLLKKFQVTFNRSLDGVLDEVGEDAVNASVYGPVNAMIDDFPINVSQYQLTG